MKIEDQVCTAEQGMRLKELGICQESIFYRNSCYSELLMKGRLVTKYGTQYKKILVKDDIASHSAFTTAEIGVMLPGIINNCRLTQWVVTGDNDNTISYGIQYRFRGDDPVNNGTYPDRSIFGDTEAIGRSNLLIALLEEKTITPEEVNQRLLSK
jgi:hypothetical protein